METSDVISAIALGVSVLSFVVTIWATRISGRAQRLAESADTRSRQQQFHQLRADILIQIAESRRQLNKTRVEIGALHAGFAAEKQPVRVLLSKYDRSLFGDYLPRIEQSIAQLDDLWQQVSSWGPDKDHAELAAMKALLHRTHVDEEHACDAATHMMAEYRRRLEEARSYVQGANR